MEVQSRPHGFGYNPLENVPEAGRREGDWHMLLPSVSQFRGFGVQSVLRACPVFTQLLSPAIEPSADALRSERRGVAHPVC